VHGAVVGGGAGAVDGGAGARASDRALGVPRSSESRHAATPMIRTAASAAALLRLMPG
jgi:hypothetical protein